MNIIFNRVTAGVMLGISLFLFLNSVTASFNPEDAALFNLQDKANRGAGFEDKQILFLVGDEGVREVSHSIKAFQGEGKKVALILGASQLHAIIRGKPGDMHVAFHANQKACKLGSDYRYIQYSMPNANANELLAVYLALTDLGVIPDLLIFAVVFDDLRESYIRKSVRNIVSPVLQMNHQRVSEDFYKAVFDGSGHDVVKRNTTAGTPQEKLESKVLLLIEKFFPPIQRRSIISSYLKFQYLYLSTELINTFREILTGAKYQRLPDIPEGIKHWNMEGIKTLTEIAHGHGVKILFYKVPHPQYHGSFFHSRDKYDSFFEWLQDLAEEKQHLYIDLEGLVPYNLWEIDKGELDLFHFRMEGHKLLGSKLAESVNDLKEL